MAHDITHIKQLLAAYCHRVDRGTPDEVAALFAEDGVLRPAFDGAYEVRGRAAIRGWYAHYNTRLRDGLRHLKHMISSLAIEVSGEQARGSCYFTACFISNDTDKASLCFGTYTDSFRRIDGSWLFGERVIETHIVLPGLDALERFPSLQYPGAS